MSIPCPKFFKDGVNNPLTRIFHAPPVTPLTIDDIDSNVISFAKLLYFVDLFVNGKESFETVESRLEHATHSNLSYFLFYVQLYCIDNGHSMQLSLRKQTFVYKKATRIIHELIRIVCSRIPFDKITEDSLRYDDLPFQQAFPLFSDKKAYPLSLVSGGRVPLKAEAVEVDTSLAGRPTSLSQQLYWHIKRYIALNDAEYDPPRRQTPEIVAKRVDAWLLRLRRKAACLWYCRVVDEVMVPVCQRLQQQTDKRYDWPRKRIAIFLNHIVHEDDTMVHADDSLSVFAIPRVVPPCVRLLVMRMRKGAIPSRSGNRSAFDNNQRSLVASYYSQFTDTKTFAAHFKAYHTAGLKQYGRDNSNDTGKLFQAHAHWVAKSYLCKGCKDIENMGLCFIKEIMDNTEGEKRKESATRLLRIYGVPVTVANQVAIGNIGNSNRATCHRLSELVAETVITDNARVNEAAKARIAGPVRFTRHITIAYEESEKKTE